MTKDAAPPAGHTEPVWQAPAPDRWGSLTRCGSGEVLMLLFVTAEGIPPSPSQRPSYSTPPPPPKLTPPNKAGGSPPKLCCAGGGYS